MSGHSKWATTKRHKAAVDAKRGKLFSTLSKDITLAARDGGGDLNFNPRLRTLVAKAKATNMPADNIDRAIKKGTGEIPGVIYEQLLYEGYSVGGVGIIVEVTTENKNRSAGEVRSAFTKCGGSLATQGALQFNFNRQGQFIISAEDVDEDKLMEVALEAGAEDIKNNGDHFEVLCALTDYDNLSKALEEAQITCADSNLAWIPNTLVEVADKESAKKILKLADALEGLDDVQEVYSNYDIDDSLLED